MEKARLMDQPADFKRLGLNPARVEKWEDGLRTDEQAGTNEVWYFDADFEDKSKVAVGFRPKTVAGMKEGGFNPNLNLAITRPNGETSQEFAFAAMEDSHLGTDQCDVQFGPNYCRGDFKDYDLHVETASLAVDLHYHALTEPFRQGTAELALGDADQYFYTDLSVPKCAVTGTLTYDGQTVAVSGQGYHDHQWMNITPFAAFHHWLWGRMYTDKYVVYIYDFVTTERFGFKPLPLFMVADNQTGKVVFTTNGHFSRQTELVETSVGKQFPKTSTYLFDNGGDRAEFTVTWDQILETRDTCGDAPANQAEARARAKAAGVSDMQRVVGGTKEQYDQMGIQPTYMRFFAHGGLSLTLNGETSHSTGTMIYEYNYNGREDPRAGV